MYIDQYLFLDEHVRKTAQAKVGNITQLSSGESRK